ncbi:MAG: HAMP domain-containing histidine kinase [Gemmatimonadota bacterium]|nr:HAMP domain-containing histidine kinase [Gemmatimonadota bacterium]
MIDHTMDESARRSAFASMVAHELRTPLTAVYGALEMMTRGSATLDPAHAAVLVGLAHRNASRLLRIVEDCLDLEAASDGRLRLDRTLVTARELLELALDGAQSACEQTNVTVALRVGSQRQLLADRTRLARALTHLVQNAVTFAPPGTEVVITTSDASSHDSMRFTVEDHGPGIEPARLRELFAPFDVRETLGRRRIGGLGIGLSFVRMIAERHGGSVGAESQPGRTRFWIKVPS